MYRSSREAAFIGTTSSPFFFQVDATSQSLVDSGAVGQLTLEVNSAKDDDI